MRADISEVPGAVMIEVMAGFPSVRVPVLSTTRSLTRESFSREEGSRMRTPRRAARESPQAVATGAASPRAQGQAAMRTATAREMAVAVVSPARIQPTAVARARRRTSCAAAPGTTTATTWMPRTATTTIRRMRTTTTGSVLLGPRRFFLEREEIVRFMRTARPAEAG